MNIAVVMYDKINLLSFSTIFGYLRSFDGVKIKTCAFKQDITDEFGLKIQPEVFGEGIYGADLLVIPDGIGALNLRHDEIFLSWIKSGASTKHKLGLNLGSLIFGGAGFLEGKKASIKGGYKNALSEYCEIFEGKVCQSNGVISAAEYNDELKELLAKIVN